jgi:hypothetical protein
MTDSHDGLTVVLADINHTFEVTAAASDKLLAKTHGVSNEIDEALGHAKRIVEDREIQVEIDDGDTNAVARARPAVESQTNWDDLVQLSKTNPRSRGIDPEALEWEDLLDAETIRRINQRFNSSFVDKICLDSYDLCAAVAAGLIGALADFLVVRIPKSIDYVGNLQRGSPLSTFLRDQSVPHDNWLGRYCKASFDRVADVPTSGFSPSTHRLQTFAHDPLLGPVVGVIDILRGGMTTVSRDGQVAFIPGGPAQYNVLSAMTTEVLHLMSDVFTPMGVPAPLWSLGPLADFGALGPDDQTIGELARGMYVDGYDFRHFLTMSTSVAAVGYVLRGYFFLRRRFDEEYGRLIQAESSSGTVDSRNHPRMRSMELVGHLVATAANAGKASVYGGNPLAINYAQWLLFISSSFAFMGSYDLNTSNVLAKHTERNLRMLYEGWENPVFSEPDFPTISDA